MKPRLSRGKSRSWENSYKLRNMLISKKMWSTFEKKRIRLFISRSSSKT